MEDFIGQAILNFLTQLQMMDASLAKQLAESLDAQKTELAEWIISIITQYNFNDALNILNEASINGDFSSE